MYCREIFVAFTLVCSLSLGHGDVNISEQTSSSDSSSNAFGGNGYEVNTFEQSKDGKCLATLSIVGNGINKKVQSPCPKEPQEIINVNQTLLVGSYFSDTPSVLVHLDEDNCTSEKFKEDQGKWSSDVQSMSDEDCKKVREKVEVLKQQHREWKEWMAVQQQQTLQQLAEMQQNLQSLQQQLFGGWPFNGN